MANSPTPEPVTPTVAVVTVSYGSEAVLGPFLSSLGEAASVPLHIVVADNKPTIGGETDSAVAVMTIASGGRYLPLSSNRGYGHAINAAVATLPPEISWVVVSNPDVIVHAGSIDALLDCAESSDRIAAIGPRILSSSGEIYPSARGIPSLRSGIGHAIFADVWPSNPWTRRYRRDAHGAAVRRDAGWLSGAFLMVRRSVFDQLNGFDESYFMYFEDVDLGYRIGKLGLRNVFEPSASVVHTGAHSTRTESARMIRAHHDSAKKFLYKKYPGPLLWPLRMALTAGLNLRAMVSQRHSQ